MEKKMEKVKNMMLKAKLNLLENIKMDQEMDMVKNILII